MNVHSHDNKSRLQIHRAIKLLPVLVVVSYAKEKQNLLCPFTLENSVSRDRFGRPVPREPAH